MILKADRPPLGEGWTPPTTIGGKWTRINPGGFYEFWPQAALVDATVTTSVAFDAPGGWPLVELQDTACPGKLALCGVPCGCRGQNESHYLA